MVPFYASATSLMTSSIESHEFVGSAKDLHALAMPTEGDLAQLWVMRPTAPALVMGSSQKPEMFERDLLMADGVELANRRSGGGAVFIDPASTVWIDLVAPRSSDLWSSELSENFMIVGRRWHQALELVGLETTVFGSAPDKSDAARVACWAGIGWGELIVGDAKVVGLSQRRTRWGARVQAMAVLDSSSARVTPYLKPEFRSLIDGAIPTLTTGLDASAVETAVLNAF